MAVMAAGMFVVAAGMFMVAAGVFAAVVIAIRVAAEREGAV